MYKSLIHHQRNKTRADANVVRDGLQEANFGRKYIPKPLHDTDLDRLYIGAETAAEDKEWRRETGITAIVTMCFRDKTIVESDSLTKFILYPLARNWLYYPVDDDENENLIDAFDIITAWIRNQLIPSLGASTNDINGTIADYGPIANPKVLVHCQAGMSRSATIVLAYLIRYHNFTLEDALKYLKTQRPCVAPNTGFMNQLKQYELLCQSYNG